MKNIIILVLFFIVNNICNAQTSKLFNIDNIITIQVSNELEIQNGTSKILSDKLRKQINRITFNSTEINPNIVWQQTGINQMDKSALNKFVRLIVGIQNEYESIKTSATNPIKLTSNDLKLIANDMEKSIIQSAPLEGSTLLGKVNTKIEKIGNYYALCTFWQVKNLKFSILNYSSYTFIHRGKRINISTIYKMSENNIWKPILLKTLNSISLSSLIN